MSWSVLTSADTSGGGATLALPAAALMSCTGGGVPAAAERCAELDHMNDADIPIPTDAATATTTIMGNLFFCRLWLIVLLWLLLLLLCCCSKTFCCCFSRLVAYLLFASLLYQVAQK